MPLGPVLAPTAARSAVAAATSRTIDPSILYVGTPVVLVSTRNPDGTANLAPISSAWWLDTTGVIGIGTRSHTVANLRRHPECVLNLASADLVSAVDRLALTTGSDPVPDYKRAKEFRHAKDKLGRAGLTSLASELVAPPRVAECPIQLEAEVMDIHPIGRPHDHSAAVEVSVVRTHVHESILDPANRHHVDPDRWRLAHHELPRFYGLRPRLHRSRLAEVF